MNQNEGVYQDSSQVQKTVSKQSQQVRFKESKREQAKNVNELISSIFSKVQIFMIYQKQ